ncbi:hypothetical protein B0T22DRAFT_494097 [Podospora appendiculata]|uniref:G domain-containing protein n=1 Tax=Podospora appendiculata TaxID=314037 RepID=A0AAE1C843_9PEZI|nr:hypothetical protein B0T22DRAFT_494097 [Podospora appendiculata]
MASTGRKNVIFIGMTQNGKSSLIQQILRYAGEEELSRTVGIGQGNFSQTQVCSSYDVDVPLKTHRLRQIEGPDDEEDKNGSYITPGDDFRFDDVDEYKLGQDVEDSGDRLPLRLIDTPGLSDSGNAQSSSSSSSSSTSGTMRVVDERHKLRILLSLQKIEHVHAICFVVRRDTNFGGDFQDLVRRMVALLTFSVRSTAWNLQYHIIHTNIDVDDRASGVCESRQRAFDQFGPGGAAHHFVDNMPDRDYPLDLYFANHTLSLLFQSLTKGSAVSFTNLYYPKSPEHTCNDQALISAAQQAMSQLSAVVETGRKKMAALQADVQRHTASAQLNQVRVDDYESKIAALDCDTLVVIDSEEGWTERNHAGGGWRLFYFSTTVPIAKVEKCHDGDGEWELESQTDTSFYIILQPNWLCKCYGKVTLYGTMKEVHKDELATLRTQLGPVRTRCQEHKTQITKANTDIATLESQNAKTTTLIDALKRDVTTIRESGHSIPLAKSQKLVKFFTVDSPLSAALAYTLQAKVPWTVPPLTKIARPAVKSKMQKLVRDAKEQIDACERTYKTLSVQVGIAQGIRVVTEQLKTPPAGVAKLRAAIAALDLWHGVALKAGQPPAGSRLQGLPELVQRLKTFVAKRESFPATAGSEEEEQLRGEITVFAAGVRDFARAMLAASAVALRELQRANWEEKATRVAAGYMDVEGGLPVGVYASLIRAAAVAQGGKEEPVMAVLAELKDVGELGELALDD